MLDTQLLIIEADDIIMTIILDHGGEQTFGKVKELNCGDPPRQQILLRPCFSV